MRQSPYRTYLVYQLVGFILWFDEETTGIAMQIEFSAVSWPRTPFSANLVLVPTWTYWRSSFSPAQRKFACHCLVRSTTFASWHWNTVCVLVLRLESVGITEMLESTVLTWNDCIFHLLSFIPTLRVCLQLLRTWRGEFLCPCVCMHIDHSCPQAQELCRFSFPRWERQSISTCGTTGHHNSRANLSTP